MPALNSSGTGTRVVPSALAAIEEAGKMPAFLGKAGVPAAFHYSTFTKSVPVRPKVSGWYISSALAGGTTNWPGVVARVT